MSRQSVGVNRAVSVILSIGAILFSGIIGAVTTVVHQSSVTVFGVPIPWGLILSLVIVIAWFVGLQLLSVARWTIVGSGVVFLAAVYVLSQRGPGGSVLVPESWQGNVWVIATPLLVVVMMFWPRIRPRSAQVN